MHNLISWTIKAPDGVKCETRVQVSQRKLKWQFKRADQERWDYNRAPEVADWDMLEDVLRRRAGRGCAPGVLAGVKALRAKAAR